MEYSLWKRLWICCKVFLPEGGDRPPKIVGEGTIVLHVLCVCSLLVFHKKELGNLFL